MKGLYLSYIDFDHPEEVQSGVAWKITDQIRAFNDAGIQCEHLRYIQPASTFRMTMSCLPLFPDGVEWPDAASVSDANFLYIRQPRITSKQLLEFMQGYKEANPTGIILYEVPTYPHDKEMMNPKMFMALMKDRRHRRFLRKCVDRIVDLSGTPEIYGVKTLQIKNGIDFRRVQAKAPDLDAGDRIEILSAAHYYRSHGVDRALYGLHAYYESGGLREIRLNIAGEGAELSRYRRIAHACGLGAHVRFLGHLGRAEMDALYDECSLGLGALGIHRVGLKTCSAIKTREYLAKGLPFIYSGGVDVIDADPVDFCLKVPADDSPLNFNEVVDFYDAIYGGTSQEEVIERIREYGEAHVSMDAVMEEVIAFVRNSAAVSKG